MFIPTVTITGKVISAVINMFVFVLLALVYIMLILLIVPLENCPVSLGKKAGEYNNSFANPVH